MRPVAAAVIVRLGHAADHPRRGDARVVGATGVRREGQAALHEVLPLPLDVVLAKFEAELGKAWVGVGGGPNLDFQPVRDTWYDRTSLAHYMIRGLLRQFIAHDRDDLVRCRDAVKGKPKTLPFGAWRGGKK